MHLSSDTFGRLGDTPVADVARGLAESSSIPLGVRHRLENPGKIPLQIIEIQSGAYLAENDIVRLEDIYHRV